MARGFLSRKWSGAWRGRGAGRHPARSGKRLRPDPGRGGVLTEILQDTVSLLVPASRAEIGAALSRLRIAPLLDGYRGAPPVNRAALLASIDAVQDCVAGHAGELLELEINPLIVTPDRAVAADALITMGVLEVTLDRPKANAIDLATSRIMGEVFTEFRDDPDLRVAILTGAGEKFFCPGWDLKAAAEGDAVDGDYGVGGFGGLQELRGLNKPVIAAVNGIAAAAGWNWRCRPTSSSPPITRPSPCPKSGRARWPTRPRSSCRSASPITSRWRCC
jgi:hypothetical protein